MNKLKAKNRQAWLQTREQILRQIKAQVAQLLGPEPKDLKEYAKAYENALTARWKPSNKAEILKSLATASIVYGGDFHAYGQSQRTHLRLIRHIPRNKTLVLALEAIPIAQQKWVDLFLAGEVSESFFLRKIRWSEEWGFPWEHYKPFFDFARQYNCKILGLNSTGPNVHLNLKSRDKNAAKVLAENLKLNPDALFYVVFGDLHLAPAHLPAAVDTHFKIKPKSVFVYLNSERIYFQLAKQDLETKVDVVRFSRNRFCVLSSPPWVQWQSYLLYLERHSDSDLDDSEFDFEPVDYGDQIRILIQVLQKDLKIKSKLNDVAVYTSSEHLLWNKLSKILGDSEMKISSVLIAQGRSFFIPGRGFLFLARATVNHAAALAGEYLHAKLSNRTRLLGLMPGDFEAVVWVEACSFFMSKLINHKRAALSLRDIRARLVSIQTMDPRFKTKSPAQSLEREALALVMDQRMSELIYFYQARIRSRKFKPRQNAGYFEAAHILGGMLGEKLYLAVRSRNISFKTLMRWMKCDVEDPNFRKSYSEIVKRLEPISKRMKSQRERL